MVLVWEPEVDRAAGEHDECEGGVGGVKSEGASDDEADSVVQALNAAIGQAVFDRGEDASSVGSDGVTEFDERGESAAL